MREGRIMTIDHFPVRPLPLSHPQACQLTRGTGPWRPGTCWLLHWPCSSQGSEQSVQSGAGERPQSTGQCVPGRRGRESRQRPRETDRGEHRFGYSVPGPRYEPHRIVREPGRRNDAHKPISSSLYLCFCGLTSRARVGGRPLPCRSLLGPQLHCNSQLVVWVRLGLPSTGFDVRQRCVSWSSLTEAIERPMEVEFQIQRCLARTTRAHRFPKPEPPETQSPRTEIGRGTGSSSVMAGSQAKKHPYDSVADALKSQDFRCGHCGVLVMVLRLQPGPGGQARPSVCALQEVEMENGGGLKSGAPSSLVGPRQDESVAQPPPSLCHRDLDSLA